MEDHRSALVVLVFILAISAVSSVNTPHIHTVSEEVSRPRHDTVAPASTVDQHSPWVEQVGKHPKVYVFHGFLTDEERRHVLTMAAPEMKRSTVVGNGGAGVVDDIRTSYGMFIRRMADPIIERIERRISLFTQIPVSHQEDIQVLRYEKSQKYDAHYDSSYDGRGGVGPKQRLATLLMYLSDVEEGGETAFPHHSEWADPSIPDRLAEDGVKFSSCAAGHVAAKPKAGDAVLFYSYHANGTMDDASMHAGCPVIKGIKWAAPIWIHIDEFNPPLTRPDKPLQPRDPGVCEDIHPRCSQWASAGECEKNQGFMTGIGTTAPGQCRRACGTCTPCSHLDWACINANRRKGGFLELKKEEMDWLGVKWHARADPSPEL